MNAVLDAENQQLVVLNGDLITGENAYLSNSTDYIDQIVKPMVQRNLPWASTYGNHDSSFNLSRENILGRERLYHSSLTNQMVFGQNAGVSNYYLLVYPHDDATTPSLILWFFDSRGGFLYQQTSSGEQIGQQDWVDQSVVDCAYLIHYRPLFVKQRTKSSNRVRFKQRSNYPRSRRLLIALIGMQVHRYQRPSR